ncbi:hypothetical protein J6590_099787, partial [Homalodisca vitripennis]
WKRFVEEDRDWWKSVITADESWVYQYDPAMKIQSSEWVEKNEGRPVTFLFPTAKKELKGRRFYSEQDAVKALEVILKNMSKDGFSNVFQTWQRRWDKCISLNGEYLEGEKCYVVQN